VHELESQQTDAVRPELDDPSDSESGGPLASPQTRQREGLPAHYRMRAERHYVDHLSSTAGVPVQMIPVDQLSPRPHTGAKELEALVRSIRAHGIIQPLLVRRERTAYHLIAGRNRLAAAVEAGLREVPCIVHQVDEAGAAALESAERVRGERAVGPLRASVGAKIAEGVKEIADDLSRLRTTLGLLSASPKGFQHVVAVDLVAAQTWRTLWLANVASFLSSGKCPEGRARPLSAIVDDIVERFEPEGRLSRLRFTVRHHGQSAPHVGDSVVGFALTGAIIVTLSLVEPVADPVVEVHTHSVGEGGFILEVVQRHSIVPKETAERVSNQAVLAPAAGNVGLGAIALSHVTVAYSGASELLVTEEPGSTVRLTFPHS
jgi:ParB-like chromosome segregation protein Spo0J